MAGRSSDKITAREFKSWKYANEDLTKDSIDIKENSNWCLEDFETRLGER